MAQGLAQKEGSEGYTGPPGTSEQTEALPTRAALTWFCLVPPSGHLPSTGAKGQPSMAGQHPRAFSHHLRSSRELSPQRGAQSQEPAHTKHVSVHERFRGRPPHLVLPCVHGLPFPLTRLAIRQQR